MIPHHLDQNPPEMQHIDSLLFVSATELHVLFLSDHYCEKFYLWFRDQLTQKPGLEGINNLIRSSPASVIFKFVSAEACDDLRAFFNKVWEAAKLGSEVKFDRNPRKPALHTYSTIVVIRAASRDEASATLGEMGASLSEAKDNNDLPAHVEVSNGPLVEFNAQQVIDDMVDGLAALGFGGSDNVDGAELINMLNGDVVGGRSFQYWDSLCELATEHPNDDRDLTPEQLDDKYNQDGGGQHPKHTRQDWQVAVGLDDTLLGYWAWVHHQLQS